MARTIPPVINKNIHNVLSINCRTALADKNIAPIGACISWKQTLKDNI